MKSIRHGHSSTLQLWWAQRPRALLFVLEVAKNLEFQQNGVANHSWPTGY